MNDADNRLLRELPGADELIRMARASGGADLAHIDLKDAAVQVVGAVRAEILSGARDAVPLSDDLALKTAILARAKASYSLKPVINATGIILHTNLGRAVLARSAAEHVRQIAENYSTLEYQIETGERGSRNSLVEDLICRVAGCESAIVVNNNAAAVLLALSALCRDKEVVVSRGELVEIGGSFRVPEIMAMGSAVLREVGTTNKTRLSDYENAVTPEITGAILKVHTSNFKVVGFTQQASLRDLAQLSSSFDIPLIYDIGSGALIDLSRFGLSDEPTVGQAVESGADVITFSGDKLLGGPQCGIIAGKRKFIEPMKSHPLARAVRIDKLCLAALETTLRLYLSPETAMSEIPMLCALSADSDCLQGKAEALLKRLSGAASALFEVVKLDSQVGGGSAPGELLSSWGVAVRPRKMSVDKLEEHLRCWDPPIIARIAKGRLLMDVRTVSQEHFNTIADAFDFLGEDL